MYIRTRVPMYKKELIMIYAYARVSSKDQNLERQLNAFQNCGIAIDKILWDKESGADFDRTNYKKLIRRLRYDDLLIIKSIDRLGRNYECILCEWKRITKDIATVTVHIKKIR